VSIQPVGGVTPTSSLSDALALMGAAGTPGATGAAAVPSAPSAAGADGGFAAALGAVDNVTALQSKSNALAVQAVTGDLDDVHDYTVAASEAKLALELTAAVRNKAVDAFTEIMRMQA
jgi:flagellar hook-basal body complex protein FliE